MMTCAVPAGARRMPRSPLVPRATIPLFARVCPALKLMLDVAGALPDALKRFGHEVHVVMPLYQQTRQIGLPFRSTKLKLRVPLGPETVVADVFEADTFINMPIAKTHGMAILTMSMKNLMGIMGGERGTMHQDFEQKIVDVNSLVRPHLVILDAYRMLIRNGPTGGDLRDVRLAKTVVVGTNQASVDAFGTTLFGMKPTDLDYLHLAGKQGIGIIDLAKLSILKGTT